ncbi:MAG TPA: hypothetical protein VGR61_08215 [Candidatus Dormibacteraeota bacterium]|nr:hypothetical protein [Candidatus Dormibacteraeota bacterium]
MVAIALSPSPSEAASPRPSSAPTLAPVPASTSGPGNPLPVILLVAAVAILASGGFYWYRNRQAI